MDKNQINSLCHDLTNSIEKQLEREMPTWHLDLTTGDAAEASYKVTMKYIHEYVRLYVSEALAAVLSEKK